VNTGARSVEGIDSMDQALLKRQLLQAKQEGFSDAHLARLWGVKEVEVRRLRKQLGILPVYKTVDTCAAEFEAYTPYHYSSYETPFKRVSGEGQSTEVLESEVRPADKPKVMILGGGPNRIGQGIEFDYCCCQAVFALRKDGYETIMVNSNPETVSTDYDTADRLYFEPLTFEDVMNIVEAEKPLGVILQFGGQTPLGLALPLEAAGVNVLGTSPDSIDLTEDRKRFGALLDELKIPMPPGGTARSFEEAQAVANRIGYPVLVRPSYVLGGRAMAIVHDEKGLRRYLNTAVEASPEHPVLIDRFLQEAIEVDVDAVCDGEDVYIGAIMEHIEYAGIHSGDSACMIPPRTLSKRSLDAIADFTRRLALSLKVKGLMNIQYAVYGTEALDEKILSAAGLTREELERNGNVFVLEVNPRASRTIPYVSKAVGIPMAQIAARVMLGRSLKEQGLGSGISRVDYFSVKEAALPFAKFHGVDPILGPEMRSTGEVMGVSEDFGIAFAKAQESVNMRLPQPEQGAGAKKIFLSVNDLDKKALLPVARDLHKRGVCLVATGGTRQYLEEHGVPAEFIHKLHGGRPSILDLIINKEVALMINTPLAIEAEKDDLYLRRAAVEHSLPYITTIAAARALVEGVRSHAGKPIEVKALQDYHKRLKALRAKV
jgi:carbamoyl-phosphate synthase large subunit